MGNKKRIIGLDIGGSKMLGVLFDGEKPLKKIKKETPQKRKEFLDVLKKVIKELASGTQVGGVSVGIAGMLDKSGKMLRSPNMGFLDGFNLKRELEKEFSSPILIENDVNCFTYAEGSCGVAKGAKSVVGITLGTGIGGGIVLNGNVYKGAAGSAGEIGHMIINNETSFEELASAKGVARLCDEDIFELEKEARKGKGEAIRVFQEVGKHLGIGLANIINILNPEVIVIGGGLSNLGDLILKSAKENCLKFIANPAARETKIVLSKLGEIAIPLGAILFFKKEKEPS